MSEEALRVYKWEWNCGRMGTLTSLFVATPAQVKDAIGREVDFGEEAKKTRESADKVAGCVDQWTLSVRETMS